MMIATFLFHRQPVVVLQGFRLTIYLLVLIVLRTPDFQHHGGTAQACWLLSSSTTTTRHSTLLRLARRRISSPILRESSPSAHDEPTRHNKDAHVLLTNPSVSQQSLLLVAPKCRRDVLQHSLLSLSMGLAFLTTATTTTTAFPEPAHALVKGNAPPPPPPKTKASADKPKCTNVEECQALAEQKEQVERQEAAAKDSPTKTTKGGTRYKDLDLGNETGSVVVVKDGDAVTLHYKVLKLGKRSYDGLSGEGTVIFSRGYGLEDDEVAPGDHAFTTTVGAPYNIVALNEALRGIRVGGTRRFSIFPSQGWRKPGRDCDGRPGGTGAGGDVKTDYVVVPTAQVVAAEACLDATKLPFPTSSYGEQRRMAQRFDQSLIMEVQVVSINAPGGGLF
jgi:FKBP-type peptidyl-prolyl cis-trans isomerase